MMNTLFTVFSSMTHPHHDSLYGNGQPQSTANLSHNQLVNAIGLQVLKLFASNSNNTNSYNSQQQAGPASFLGQGATGNPTPTPAQYGAMMTGPPGGNSGFNGGFNNAPGVGAMGGSGGGGAMSGLGGMAAAGGLASMMMGLGGSGAAAGANGATGGGMMAGLTSNPAFQQMLMSLVSSQVDQLHAKRDLVSDGHDVDQLKADTTRQVIEMLNQQQFAQGDSQFGQGDQDVPRSIQGNGF